MSYKGQTINVIAIVDSGSDVSYLPHWAAETLGVAIKGTTSFVETVNGKIKVVQDFINLTIRHKNEVERFVLPFYTPIDNDYTDEVILGRMGFFNRFDITFKENSKRIILTKSQRH